MGTAGMSMIIKFVKYSIVGILGATLHTGTLIFLVEILKQNPLVSSAAGFLTALIVQYFMNYLWTFRSDQNHRYALPRYVFVSVTGLAMNVSIMYITVNIFGWWYLIGQAIAIILVPISNFLLNYSWSFRTNSADMDRKSSQDDNIS
jgi:putative flippase GtrA